MPADYKRVLLGRWVHSHEEDTGDVMVFRRETHAFPPSRGRMSLELRPDGTYVEQSPGPVDVPEESTGEWSLEGNRLILSGEHGRSGFAWNIEVARRDVLRVKK